MTTRTLREQIEHDTKLFAQMPKREREMYRRELRSCMEPEQPWWSPRY